MKKQEEPKVAADALKLKKQSKEPKGTYIATSSGKLIRTTPLYKDVVEVQSMDTTGYAKGKQNFELKTSKPSQAPSTENVSRTELQSVIEKLKKGATRTEDWRTSTQKKNAQSK